MDERFGSHMGGKEKARVAFNKTELSTGVLEYLRKAECFSIPEQKLEAAGISKHQDYPQVQSHRYYEGYYHGARTPIPIASVNPRRPYEQILKPAAPIQIRAFLQAFRKANQHWLESLGRTLQKSETVSCVRLADLIQRGFNFADIALQIHAGGEVGSEDIGWHQDGLNSILHMAVSIHGTRTLHTQLARTASGVYEEEATDQTGGDVYVSSPSAFRHGVRYPQIDQWSERVVALQCRLLLTMEDQATLYVSSKRNTHLVIVFHLVP
jgi:hypothetical protein